MSRLNCKILCHDALYQGQVSQDKHAFSIGCNINLQIGKQNGKIHDARVELSPLLQI